MVRPLIPKSMELDAVKQPEFALPNAIVSHIPQKSDADAPLTISAYSETKKLLYGDLALGVRGAACSAQQRSENLPGFFLIWLRIW